MENATGENEKKLLASVLKERLIEKRNTITYKELLNEKMPAFLKNFLQKRVQKYFLTDEPFQFNNSKRYDFNHKKIKSLIGQLRNAFEEATLFTKEEILEIINLTVGLQFDLIIAPKKTLKNIFYKNKSERTQTDILKILKGLSDKRIFINNLIIKISQFDQFHIVEEDFCKILDQVEKDVYGRDFIAAFFSDVEIFLEFSCHISGKEQRSINREILKLLLIERNVPQYYEAFNSVYSANDWFDLENISKLLAEHFKKLAYDEKPNNDLDNYVASFTGENELTEKSEADSENIKDDTGKHYPKIEAWKEPQDFIIRREMIEYQPEVMLVSLFTLFEEKNKKLIQKKIFKKDEEAFVNFIKRLDEIDNWKEAKTIIDDELMMRSVQPFSREALVLGDIVFNRYFPQKV